MAALEQPEIHKSQHGTLKPELPGHVPTEDEILRWVAKISDNYIDAASLDILKLSVRSELTQDECDRIECVSDLYHALAKHYTTPKALLSRLIYALENLGHRRYGRRAVRELSSYSLPPFELSTAKLRSGLTGNDFILLQRLAALCCMLPEGCHSRFISHFAKKKLNANPSIYQSPCKVLTKLLLEHIITTDNLFDEIEEALIKVELSESQIKEYFDNCEKIADFQRLRTSSCSPSKASSDCSSPDQTKKKQGARPYSPPSSDSGSSPIPKSITSSSSGHRDLPTESSPLLSEESGAQTTYTNGVQDQPLDEGPQQPANVGIRIAAISKKKKTKIICCTILVLVLAAAVVAALLIGFAVKQYQSNQPTTERYRENSSVILAEPGPFYTESLSVIEDTEHLNDFRHDIEVYHAGCKCSDLITLTTYTLNGSDHDLTPVQPIYALANSSISVHICGSTNATTDSERLDIMLKNNLEEENFRNNAPYEMNFFHPGLGGKMRCKDVVFHLLANDYYTVIIMNPSSQIQFHYELTYKIQKIDSILLAEHALANYTLQADQESCKFSLRIGKKSCFVAMIKENPNTTKGDVHIQLKYGHRWGWFIAGVIVLVLSAIAFVVSIIVISLFIRCTKHAKIE